MMMNDSSPDGAATPAPNPFAGNHRRGLLQAGDRIQITDVKKNHYTITLTRDGYFQSRRGNFHHREVIGKPEGTVLQTEDGHQLLILRPLMSDFALSMPRGATVVYPKDAGSILAFADIFPGARVLEAGAGSGALSIALLGAIGERGHLLSVERRADFAEIASGNVHSWYGAEVPNWDLRVGELAEVVDNQVEEASFDRVVLDMLAPWENIDQVARALVPGGLVVCYVATTTQLSRIAEVIKDSQRFTRPEASETLVRPWHLQGLAVRPDHRMVAHTGFILTARRLAPGAQPLGLASRPAKAAYSEPLAWEDGSEAGQAWDSADLGERTMADRKVRRVVRDVRRRTKMEKTGWASPRAQANNGESSQEITNE